MATWYEDMDRAMDQHPEWFPDLEPVQQLDQFCTTCRGQAGSPTHAAHFAETREPAQPVPLGDCGHPAWGCACNKHRQPIESDDDPTVQHEPVVEEGY